MKTPSPQPTPTKTPKPPTPTPGPTKTPGPTATPRPTATPTAPPPPHDITINRSSVGFTPKTLTIQPGQTVVWYQADNNHTVTSDTNGSWSSVTLGKGDTYSHKFNDPGTYGYHCAIHSSMKGTIVVQ